MIKACPTCLYQSKLDSDKMKELPALVQKKPPQQLESWNEMIFFTVWARNNYFKTNNISISFAQ